LLFEQPVLCVVVQESEEKEKQVPEARIDVMYDVSKTSSAYDQTFFTLYHRWLDGGQTLDL
jgi:hypothetical protein